MNLWLLASAGFPSLSFPLAFHKALSRGRVDLQKSQKGFILFLFFLMSFCSPAFFNLSMQQHEFFSLQVPSSPSEPDPLMWSDGVKTLGCYMAAKVPKIWWMHGSWPKNLLTFVEDGWSFFPIFVPFFKRSCLGFRGHGEFAFGVSINATTINATGPSNDFLRCWRGEGA